MPDIFGRNPEDYPFVRALHANNQWERYQAGNAERRPASMPQHDFNALGAGAPREFARAAEDAQALGFLTNNLLGIQTMIDNIMYTAYRCRRLSTSTRPFPKGNPLTACALRTVWVVRLALARRATTPLARPFRRRWCSTRCSTMALTPNGASTNCAAR